MVRKRNSSSGMGVKGRREREGGQGLNWLGQGAYISDGSAYKLNRQSLAGCMVRKRDSSSDGMAGVRQGGGRGSGK